MDEFLELFYYSLAQQARFCKDLFTALSVLSHVISQNLLTEKLTVLGCEEQENHLSFALNYDVFLFLDDLETRLRTRVANDEADGVAKFVQNFLLEWVLLHLFQLNVKGLNQVHHLRCDL